MKKLSFPHPMVILLAFVVLSWIASFLIPSGTYSRELDPKTGREVVLQGSYKQIEKENISLQEMVVSIPEGLILGSDIGLDFIAGRSFLCGGKNRSPSSWGRITYL